MKTYRYDIETREYIGEYDCPLDPLESEQAGSPVYMVPDWVTDIRPEPPDGTVAVFNGGGWIYIEDHRGEPYWLPGAKYGDAPSIMTGLGPFPEGALLTMPEQGLDEAKAAKLAEINAQCDVILDTAVSSYPQSEVLTFDQQVSEVEKYQSSSNPASAPLLSALADARGISLDELCLRVMTKRAQFSVLSGIIIGQRQRLEDILDTLTTVAEVQALDVQIRMPTDPPDSEGNPTDTEAA